MWWAYVIVAITCLVVGFMLCAILSANKYRDITIEELIQDKEEEDEDEDE